MDKNFDNTVASVGCGVIGCSWVISFARAGYYVNAYNRSRKASIEAEKRIMTSLENLKVAEVIDDQQIECIFQRISFLNNIKETVENAFFIQESSAERYELKYKIIEEIELYAKEDSIVASSTSGLLVSKMIKNAKYKSRFIGGHPYNPPHLIPLVEITKTEFTNDAVLSKATEFYDKIGNKVVVLNKEIPGFICNRLQIALYREICHLVMNGVCSIEDADKAVVYGPGLRWGIMGPSLLFELGGGDSGVEGLLEHLDESIKLWLEDMADFKEFPKEWKKIAQDGVCQEIRNRDLKFGNDRNSLEKYRDGMIIKMRKLHNIY